MEQQAFNDGIIKIYRVTDIAPPGDMPREGLKLIETLRYQRRTLGLTRYYKAKQVQQQVSAVLRCPYRKAVTSQDVAVVDGQQYRVELVQRPEDIQPPVIDLTLSRLEQDYELTDN